MAISRRDGPERGDDDRLRPLVGRRDRAAVGLVARFGASGVFLHDGGAGLEARSPASAHAIASLSCPPKSTNAVRLSSPSCDLLGDGTAQIRYHRPDAPIRREVRPAVDHRTLDMTTTESPTIALAPLDLAAMLCSRVCHDVISPVGAIINGLEVLEDESDPSMRDVAIDLIKRSAEGASARLQFCRLAFGAAGSVGASIDTGDAENVARGLLETEKTALAWKAQRQFLPKNKVKLLLNLSQIAAATIPRGGVIEVDVTGEGEAASLRVSSKGVNARLQAGFADLLCGRNGAAKVDAHSIQPYFAGLVARECGMAIAVEQGLEGFAFLAEPVAAEPSAVAENVEETP